ncbi:hypothetical protein PG997_000792 [Apiospora hydei]|uniref:RNase III domain-containing protein n=1 Tax=Apiospora hydei TaxID=1337664 RepID=A0ABR1XBR1_9PEZI
MSKRQFSEFSTNVNANDAISAIIHNAESLLKAACALKADLASGKQNSSSTEAISNISRDLLPAVTYFAGSSSSSPSNKAPKLDLDGPSTFTHSGMVSKPGDMSYERLEWVGDAYLEMFATNLIYQTFPNLPAGRCSQYPGQTYHISPEFDFGSNINGQGAKAKTHRKVLGDIFEAYVAAVILGDPQSGLARASSWMKALWSKEFAKEIKTEYNARQRSQQAGADAASCDTPSTSASAASQDAHPKTRLTQRIGTKGVRIYYLDEYQSVDKKSKQPKFTVGAYVDAWGESKVQLGTGTALSKTEAGAKAAQNALDNKKLMKKYEQKKKELEDTMKAQLQCD